MTGMKYLKFALCALRQKPLFNILIMAELAAILIVGNMAIAIYNSRSAFYDPYRDILAQDGFVFVVRTGRSSAGFDNDLRIKNTLDSLDGDVTVVNNYSLQLVTDDVMFVRNIVAVDKEIFDRMKLPLESGRWASTEKTSKGKIEAVVYKGSDIKDTRLTLGNVIDGTINDKPCKIKITGIIGNGQYVPSLACNVHIESEKSNVMNFYSIPESGNACCFFVSASADNVLSDPNQLGGSIGFVYYNSKPDYNVRKSNLEKLMGISKNLSALSDYKRNTLDYIHEQYIKLTPILLCVFIIVLAELICSAAMNTKAQLRNYGVYFLCGCRWKDCLKISLSYSLFILTGGCVIGASAFLIFQATPYAALFEQHLAPNNFYITMITAAFILFLSIIVPFFMIRRTSPVSIIREG